MNGRTKLYSILLLVIIAVFSLNAKAADVPVVNVNTATVDQLCYLPGVGPVIAQRIVDARPIATVTRLDEVKGIGAKKLESMRAHVVVEGATTATEKIKLPKETPAK